MKFEINVPDNFNIAHARTAINDALLSSSNVTHEEHSLVDEFLRQIKEAMPKMKKFNVIYYGVVEADDDIMAEGVALAARPSNKNFVGLEASYKYVSHKVHDCVPEDTYNLPTGYKDYVIDGYYNGDPFSVFYNQKMIFTESQLNDALIPDNPKSQVTITKIHK
jgi:hypothetical protein